MHVRLEPAVARRLEVRHYGAEYEHGLEPLAEYDRKRGRKRDERGDLAGARHEPLGLVEVALYGRRHCADLVVRGPLLDQVAQLGELVLYLQRKVRRYRAQRHLHVLVAVEVRRPGRGVRRLCVAGRVVREHFVQAVAYEVDLVAHGRLLLARRLPHAVGRRRPALDLGRLGPPGGVRRRRGGDRADLELALVEGREYGPLEELAYVRGVAPLLYHVPQVLAHLDLQLVHELGVDELEGRLEVLEVLQVRLDGELLGALVLAGVDGLEQLRVQQPYVLVQRGLVVLEHVRAEQIPLYGADERADLYKAAARLGRLGQVGEERQLLDVEHRRLVGRLLEYCAGPLEERGRYQVRRLVAAAGRHGILLVGGGEQLHDGQAGVGVGRA